MKWTADDVTVFFREKQYIDTLLLPLQPVSFTDDMKQSASMQEFVEALTREIEKQFKGRVMLSPAFPYLKKESLEEHVQEVQKWTQEAKRGGFAHIIFITSDAGWKQVEKNLDGMLLWMPFVPFENLENSYKKQIISEQMKQLLPLLTMKWNE
ncbi:YpiF family protein [Sinobaca sp. H24]|uniref:YpiF family protein n=1 Tax=Sinobaca sp. H24 TaxID=2923376 RepID=UPI002079F889|nr:YpiF family protein [Sinobaca sp. H24]